MRRHARPKTRGKQIANQSILGQQGINLVEQRLLGMGFVWYPAVGLEAGIDGHFEIRDPVTGELSNSIVQVQSKATNSPLGTDSNGTFDWICDERDIDYWMSGNAPVILVVSRPSHGEVYWVSIKDYFKDLARRKQRKVRFDKTRDCFDSSARDSLAQLGVAKDRGIYFAPPPKKEQVYSNLLEIVGLPNRIFIAEASQGTTREAWEALRRQSDNPESEWILKSKRIMSVHDLRVPPWTSICDRGSVEDFPTSEWAASDDQERQQDFVWLLNRCLGAKTRVLGLRFDRSRDYFYFPATHNLKRRTVRYHSLKKVSTKTVFQRYSAKRDPSVTAYYRHAAFEGWFRRYTGLWYLEIVPTYRFTQDGHLVHPHYERKLKGIKALERNLAVLSHVLMWAELLGEREYGLFDHPVYSSLKFGRLLTLDVGAGVDDLGWLPTEEEDTKVLLYHDPDAYELFDDEN